MSKPMTHEQLVERLQAIRHHAPRAVDALIKEVSEAGVRPPLNVDEWLKTLVCEEMDRCKDQLLQPQECDQQVAECERSIDMARKFLNT
jgi:hypothetical protein